VKTFAKSLYVLWFYKNGARNQRADVSFFWRSSFFSCFSGKLGEIWASLGEIWAKMVLEVLWFEKMRPKWNAVIFLRLFFSEIFSGKFREIWAKSFAPPKICLLLHLWKAMGFQGLHWLQKVGSGKALFTAKVVL